MTYRPTTLSLSCALTLLLAACGGDDNMGTASDTTDATETSTTTGNTGSTDAMTTTGEPSTTGTVDPTTSESDATNVTTATETSTTTVDTSTTDAVDPCDACGADASCEGDRCVCDSGFDGDGETCTDIDECAGKNDCGVDATCTNTPGAYDCACNEGYKGNGKTCTDIDECTQDLDNCSMNANCTNQDGAFKCECKPGFKGDGVTCNGSKEFGDPCKAGEDCESGICLTGGPGMCTVPCTQNVANDCGDQGLAGLCISVGMDTFVCAGDLTFGTDKDDEILKDGDTVKRNFQTKTDADVFLIEIAVAGTYQVAAFPDPDDTLQIEFYNSDATELGTVMSPGIGMPAGGNVDAAAGIFFAVVRNTSNSNGAFTISVTKQ